jgi:hypothetical protein
MTNKRASTIREGSVAELSDIEVKHKIGSGNYGDGNLFLKYIFFLKR